MNAERAAKIERIARAICSHRGMGPDEMVTAEILYQVDDIKCMPTLPPFPAWKRYEQVAKVALEASEAA